MSEENAELIRRSADAFNRRDLDALLALCDPDVELFSLLAELEGGGPYRGHDGIRRWWDNLFGVWSDARGEIEEVRDLGDVMVARVRVHGHGRGSDAPWEHTQWQVTEWREGKTIRLVIFTSEDEALEAAGLGE